MQLKEFLIHHLDAGNVEGVKWLDKEVGKFQIPWPDLSKKKEDRTNIFKLWARNSKKTSNKAKTISDLKHIFRMALTSREKEKIIMLLEQPRSVDKFPCRIYAFKKSLQIQENDEPVQLMGEPEIPAFINDHSPESSHLEVIHDDMDSIASTTPTTSNQNTENSNSSNWSQKASEEENLYNAMKININSMNIPDGNNFLNVNTDGLNGADVRGSLPSDLQDLSGELLRFPSSNSVSAENNNYRMRDGISSVNDSQFNQQHNTALSQTGVYDYSICLHQPQNTYQQDIVNKDPCTISMALENGVQLGEKTQPEAKDQCINQEKIVEGIVSPKPDQTLTKTWRYDGTVVTSHKCVAESWCEMYVELVYLGHVVQSFHSTSASGFMLHFKKVERKLPENFKQDFYGGNGSERDIFEMSPWPCNIGTEEAKTKANAILSAFERGITIQSNRDSIISVVRNSQAKVHQITPNSTTNSINRRTQNGIQILNFHKEFENYKNHNSVKPPPGVEICIGQNPIDKFGQILKPKDILILLRVTSCRASDRLRRDEIEMSSQPENADVSYAVDLSHPNTIDKLASVLDAAKI